MPRNGYDKSECVDGVGQDNVDGEKLTNNVQITKPKMIKPFNKRLNRNEEYKFKWVNPIKTFPEKYGTCSKIRIIQDVDAHNHH